MLKESMDLLRILHGAYNTAIALAFVYQGWLGLKIRKSRAGGAKDFPAVKRHRGIGPPLVLLGILGYLAGVVLIYIDKGHLFEYRLHNLVGSLIVILLMGTFLISRKIKASGPAWRTPHVILGLAILGAYLVQLFLGLNILL
jgi:hypothetical protein